MRKWTEQKNGTQHGVLCKQGWTFKLRLFASLYRPGSPFYFFKSRKVLALLQQGCGKFRKVLALYNKLAESSERFSHYYSKLAKNSERFSHYYSKLSESPESVSYINRVYCEPSFYKFKTFVYLRVSGNVKRSPCKVIVGQSITEFIEKIVPYKHLKQLKTI